jgi:hypothetical protein
MAAERQIPGGPCVNETTTKQEVIPGGPAINEGTDGGVGGATVDASRFFLAV